MLSIRFVYRIWTFKPWMASRREIDKVRIADCHGGRAFPPEPSRNCPHPDYSLWMWRTRSNKKQWLSGDSGEAERWFRKEAERHSGMNPNTIGA
jgi:hypothetical protein